MRSNLNALKYTDLKELTSVNFSILKNPIVDVLEGHHDWDHDWQEERDVHCIPGSNENFLRDNSGCNTT